MMDEPSSLDIVGPCVSLPLEVAELPSEPASPLARPPELAPLPRAADAEPFEAAVDFRTFLAARLTDGAGLSGDAPGITEALAEDCQDQLGVDIIGPAGTTRPEHCVMSLRSHASDSRNSPVGEATGVEPHNLANLCGSIVPWPLGSSRPLGGPSHP